MGEDLSEREREHLSTSREACMLEVYRRRKKKIKHVNKTWPYLVHPMMLLGGKKKKENVREIQLFFLYKKAVFYLSLINPEVTNIILHVSKPINKTHRSNHKSISGVVV